jgi:hypothetical protein
MLRVDLSKLLLTDVRDLFRKETREERQVELQDPEAMKQELLRKTSEMIQASTREVEELNSYLDENEIEFIASEELLGEDESDPP